MTRPWLAGVLACALFLTAAPAMAGDRYVVGYALEQGASLVVVSEVTLDRTDSREDALRDAFAERLRGRPGTFTHEVAVFSTQQEAAAFRADLIARAEASGTVERLAPTVAEQTAMMSPEQAAEFNSWPFSRAEAKRRQLLASKYWNLPLELKFGTREFVLIPPGEFMMGSPAGEPGRKDDEGLHRVRITQPFYLAKDDEQVTMNSGWFGEIKRIFAEAPPGYRFRLPTEAEWEFAARAGTDGSGAVSGAPNADHGDRSEVFVWDVQSPLPTWIDFQRAALAKGGHYLQLYASCIKPSSFDLIPDPVKPLPCTDLKLSLKEIEQSGIRNLLKLRAKASPAPGRRYPANAFGLYDMLGRYDEVVADTYTTYPTDGLTVDPRQEKGFNYVFRTSDYAGAEGRGYILRGGHAYDLPSDVRFASRRRGGWSLPFYDYHEPNGVRLVIEPAAAGEAPLSNESYDFWKSLSHVYPKAPR